MPEQNQTSGGERVERLPPVGLVRLDNDGKTIWDVFEKGRFLGNSRVDLCSRVLKREPMRAWLEANCDPAETVVALGYDWTEGDRIDKGAPFWHPWYVDNPLNWQPITDKGNAIAELIAAGIQPPRLTREGFPHANCGGGCVKAGIKQFKKLHALHPVTYAEWEANEERIRQHLGKNVAILRDRTGGTTKPLTLRDLRERIEAEGVQAAMFEGEDWGACSCVTPDIVNGPSAPPPATEAPWFVVMLSSGAASAVAGRRVAERHGTERLTLLFADVNGEDEDNYRFLDEVVPWIMEAQIRRCGGGVMTAHSDDTRTEAP